MNNKTIYIETYGCSSNQADSQIMINLLEKGGYKVTDDETDADYLIMNTCAVKHKTEEKIMSFLTDLNRDGKTIIIVTHSPEIAEKYARTIYWIRDGKVEKVTRKSGKGWRTVKN